MPRYIVKSPGFFEGVYYDPEGKRPELHKEGPFPSKNKKEQVPSWLERVKEETAAQKKKRLAAEKKAAEATAQKADEDKADIDSVTFLDDNKTPSNVETLG